MRLINKHGMPASILTAVKPRPPTPGHIGVTELIDSPYLSMLRRKHWGEWEEDVIDRVWAILGSAVHYILEDRGNRNDLSEERLEHNFGGLTLVGRADLWEPPGVLTDYKVTSVWSYVYGVKPEWVAQLNVYRFLFEQAGFKTDQLKILMIFRDWSLNRKLQGGGDYPSTPMMEVPIPLWRMDEVERYILERLTLHQAARSGLATEVCTPAERWAKPDAWAVRKKVNKRATKVFPDEPGAVKYAEKMGEKFVVEYRPGEDTRCARFCPVREFCSYWQSTPTIVVDTSGGEL